MNKFVITPKYPTSPKAIMQRYLELHPKENEDLDELAQIIELSLNRLRGSIRYTMAYLNNGIKYDSPRKPKRKHYLKPWKDPESLFCDTVFLENILGKTITKGNECKGET